MGSVLSSVTLQVVVLVVVTAACALCCKVLPYFDTGHSGATPVSDGSQPLPSGTSLKPAESKPKKRKRRAKSQRDVGKAEGTPTELERPGRAVSSAAPKPVPRAVPFPQHTPGSFEAEDSTNICSVGTVHGSQELGAKPAAKKGRKVKASSVLLDRSVPAGGLAQLEATSGPSGPGDSDAPSTSAVAESTPLVAGPRSKSQSQPKPLNQHTLKRTEPWQRNSSSVDTDSSWTRVESHHLNHPESDGNAGGDAFLLANDLASSDCGATTTGDSAITGDADHGGSDTTDGNEMETRRTLAEKFMPKPRRTGVEDMLKKTGVPTLARVMRVIPRAGEMPAPGSTWGDYEDIGAGNATANDADGEDEGGWGVIKGKGRSRNSRTAPTLVQQTPQIASTMTKKQRQNAKKREMVKAAKAEAENVRSEGLVEHKRELERQRVIELSRSGGSKRPSGGMQATVDDKGKLVWE